MKKSIFTSRLCQIETLISNLQIIKRELNISNKEYSIQFKIKENYITIKSLLFDSVYKLRPMVINFLYNEYDYLMELHVRNSTIN